MKRLLAECLDIDVRDEYREFCREYRDEQCDEQRESHAYDGDIFHFQSTFDEDPQCDVGTDLSYGGWAKRNGFSVRVTTIGTALRNAITVAVVRVLLNPLLIWNEKMLVPTSDITRDVYIELGRAYPPLPSETKCSVGSQIIRIVIRELRAEFLAHCRKKKPADAFHCALKASKKNKAWGTGACEFCCAKRTPMSPPIIIMPCMHVLCASARCWNSSVFEKCPLCSIEELSGECEHERDRKCECSCDHCVCIISLCGTREEDHALRTVIIDDSLPIPPEFIERCGKNVS